MGPNQKNVLTKQVFTAICFNGIIFWKPANPFDPTKKRKKNKKPTERSPIQVCYANQLESRTDPGVRRLPAQRVGPSWPKSEPVEWKRQRNAKQRARNKKAHSRVSKCSLCFARALSLSGARHVAQQLSGALRACSVCLWFFMLELRRRLRDEPREVQ